MRKYFVLSILALFICIQNSLAQGFEAPSDSNAVVYFVRATNFARYVNVTLFEDSSLIANFEKANYFRYECKAGKKLFWTSAFNKQFIESDLKPGGTYIVYIMKRLSIPGINIILIPITRNNPHFIGSWNFIQVNAPVVLNEKKMEKKRKKFERKEYAKKILLKYEEKWKDSYLSHKLTPDMAIPEDYLKQP